MRPSSILPLLAFCICSCGVEEPRTTPTPSAVTAPETVIPPLKAFQQLDWEIGTSVRGEWRMACIDFESSTMRFEQRPAPDNDGAGFHNLVISGDEIGLPFHPVGVIWLPPNDLLLLGYESPAGVVVIEQWRFSPAANKPLQRPKGGRWIQKGKVWAGRVLSFVPENGNVINSFCKHPEDPNVLFMGTHDAGVVYRVDLDQKDVELVPNSKRPDRASFPALAGRGWNAISASREGEEGLRLSLVVSDFYCTIYEIDSLIDLNGDGAFEDPE